jgi:predicted nucleic acid-binding protein
VTAFYLDSSAIVKLVLEELGSNELRGAVREAALFTSRVAVVEVLKAVGRIDPDADAATVFEAFGFVELDEALAWEAAGTGRPALRALDAIHVASALLLGDEIDAFVTYDDRQAAAAREAGLAVRSPGRTTDESGRPASSNG